MHARACEIVLLPVLVFVRVRTRSARTRYTRALMRWCAHIVRVCVRVCACMRGCMRACVDVCVRACVRACMRVCVHA